MKASENKLKGNADAIIEGIQDILKQHNVSGVHSIGFHFDDDECGEGYERVCKAITDPDTGDVSVECRCIKKQ